MIRQASQTLLATLQQTEAEIGELKATLVEQLDAIHSRSTGTINSSTERVTEIAQRLDALLQARSRQTRTLAGMLRGASMDTGQTAGTVRVPGEPAEYQPHSGSEPVGPDVFGHLEGEGIDPAQDALVREVRQVESRIRQHAEETHRLYDDLAFALHFAAKLDADLIRGVWDARQKEEGTIYTPDGVKGQTGRSNGMVNHVG